MDLKDLNLTFVLGTASPSAVQMADAYATFAASGTQAAPAVVTKVVGPNDGLLYEFSPRVQSAFVPDVADTVTFALHRVVTNGTGTAALALRRPAAGKTGTTDDNKSAWFVGYTPQLATAVLMAKEDSSGLPVSMAGTGGLQSVTGGSFPAAIWTAFMTAALQGQPVVDLPAPPPGVMAPPDNCPASIANPGDPVPSGCPTPDVVPEFSNAPTATLPSGSAAPLPEQSTKQSPDGSLFSPDAQPTDTPQAPTQEFGPG
jgi:membrane peptidoglycan carboxypeptidase